MSRHRQRAPRDGQTKREELVLFDRAHVWHPFTQMEEWVASDPIVVERAEGFELVDVDGRRYLGGVSSLWVTVHGHRVPEIDDAVREQLERVAHSTLLGLTHVSAIELARELVALAPGGIEKVFYSEAGACAVEVGLKMAFSYWQRRGRRRKRTFLAFEHATMATRWAPWPLAASTFSAPSIDPSCSVSSGPPHPTATAARWGSLTLPAASPV